MNGIPTGVTLVAKRDGYCRLHVYGEYDWDNHQDLIEAVQTALTAGHRMIVADLAGVTFIDASTVRVLLRCQVMAAERLCSLRVVNPVGIVAEILEVTGAREALGGRPSSGPVRLVRWPGL